MRVSVVICTWNRCELLRDTLESLRVLEVPPGCEWELLVVNNGSDDGTDELLTEYEERLPLRRLFEPEPGLSRARNAAAHVAGGDLLLFTDDDVRVDDQWLRAFVDAAEAWPDALFFGGRILCRFAPDVPNWVKHHQTALAGMLCLRDLGPTARSFEPAEFPFGPNMALRREALGLACFDERFGLKGAEQVRGSESSVFWRLQQQGARGVWVPRALVHHYVPGTRANLAYLWRYFHGGGRMSVRLEDTYGIPPQSRLPLARVVLRNIAAFCRRPAQWPSHVAALAWAQGRHVESRRVRDRDALSARADCETESP